MRFRSAQISIAVHAIVVFALIHLGAVQQTPRQLPHIDLITTKLVFHPERPLPTQKAGGGGGREQSPPKLGKPPEVSRRPFVPPTTRRPDHEPALPVPPAIAGQQPTAPVPFEQLGDPTGLAGPPSDGPGKGPGIGRGPGKYGVGSGDEGGLPSQRQTGLTTQPVLIYKIEPEFSEEARKARLQGVVTLRAEIDEQGRAVSIQVRQGLGLGLDERAIEAVGKWRFRPATRNGKPVRAPALIEVTFRLL